MQNLKRPGVVACFYGRLSACSVWQKKGWGKDKCVEITGDSGDAVNTARMDILSGNTLLGSF